MSSDFAECVLRFSSVHMEESSVMQGAQGMLVQNWPTVSSAAGEWLCSSQDVLASQMVTKNMQVIYFARFICKNNAFKMFKKKIRDVYCKSDGLKCIYVICPFTSY